MMNNMLTHDVCEKQYTNCKKNLSSRKTVIVNLFQATVNSWLPTDESNSEMCRRQKIINKCVDKY